MKKRWKGYIVEYGTQLAVSCSGYGFTEAIESLKGKGQLAITIEPWKSTTSNPQFRYYYGVVLPLISKQTGHSKDTLDAILKSRFLYEYVQVGNVVEKIPLSKTAITTTQFAEFLEEVICWAAEFLDLVIPEPEEAEE